MRVSLATKNIVGGTIFMQEMIVKDVDLMGNTVMAAMDSGGTIWVGVKWMCRGMGMSEGQWKRQITNIQKDLLLKKAGSNLVLPTGGGEKEVFCLKNDYLPIWLAKISITPKIQKENPDLADKLLDYQLKAKDILAEAFLPKQEPPTSVAGQIQLLAKGNMELNQRVDAVTEDVNSVKEEMQEIKDNLPILPLEADNIVKAVKRRGVEVLGGKESPAYNGRGLRQKLYNDLYANLKHNFDVRTYKAIRRKDADKAVQIASEYKPPLFLAQQIESVNAQHTLDLEGGVHHG